MEGRVIVNVVFYGLIINVFLMAIAFGIVAGVATISPRYEPVRGLFAPAATFLGVVGTFLGVVRSFLVDMLADVGQ